MSSSAGRVSRRLLPNQAFIARLPSGAKSGCTPCLPMTALSASGMWAMFVTTAPHWEKTGLSGV